MLKIDEVNKAYHAASRIYDAAVEAESDASLVLYNDESCETYDAYKTAVAARASARSCLAAAYAAYNAELDNQTKQDS